MCFSYVLTDVLQDEEGSILLDHSSPLLATRLFSHFSFVADGRQMNHSYQYTCQGRKTHLLNELFLLDAKIRKKRS
jgi:hypothetical protein